MVISFRKGLSCPPEHEAQTEKYGVRKRERDRARKTETELRNRGREGGRETERERERMCLKNIIRASRHSHS